MAGLDIKRPEGSPRLQGGGCRACSQLPAYCLLPGVKGGPDPAKRTLDTREEAPHIQRQQSLRDPERAIK
jgi:hypothetical protein